MMHRWYIKYRRSSVDNELYFAEKFTRRQAWQDLILTTNHKDWQIIVRWNYIEIKRGQNWYSEETFAKRRKWSRNKVRRFLKHLETEHQIEQQKSKLKTVITIINREKYQGNGTTDETTERHQTKQQTDTNKNVKNVKEWKEEKKTLDTGDVVPNKPPVERKKFIKPTIEEINKYCFERKNGINAEHFFDHYESNGRKVWRNPMIDRKATVRTWEKSNFKQNGSPPTRRTLNEQEYKLQKEKDKQAQTSPLYRKIIHWWT